MLAVTDPPSKGFKSTINKISNDTSNTEKIHFAAQFTQSRKNVANYLKRTVAEERYLVVETVRTGKVQTILLPPPVDMSVPDAEDKKSYKKRQSGQSQNANKVRRRAQEGLCHDMGSVFPGST
jgi:hypothetical protein